LSVLPERQQNAGSTAFCVRAASRRTFFVAERATARPHARKVLFLFYFSCGFEHDNKYDVVTALVSGKQSTPIGRDQGSSSSSSRLQVVVYAIGVFLGFLVFLFFFRSPAISLLPCQLSAFVNVYVNRYNDALLCLRFVVRECLEEETTITGRNKGLAFCFLSHRFFFHSKFWI
jgi:hypothetical protein